MPPPAAAEGVSCHVSPPTSEPERDDSAEGVWRGGSRARGEDLTSPPANDAAADDVAVVDSGDGMDATSAAASDALVVLALTLDGAGGWKPTWRLIGTCARPVCCCCCRIDDAAPLSDV